MLLRVQSAEGTKRVEVTPGESLQLLYKKVSELFNLPQSVFKLYHDRLRQKEVSSSSRRTIKGLKVGHGDMLYLHSTVQEVEPMDVGNSIDSDSKSSTASTSLPSTSTSTSNGSHSLHSKGTAAVTEDKVDQQLLNEEGTIPGKRNPSLCHHKGNSRCIHCTDVDPWDENYLKTNNIKHMSFHTYIRKLKSGVDKGKFVQFSSIPCSIRSGCSDHPPWPQGICSSCQPSAITLNRQNFRHVDAVIFENKQIVENFLTYWRTTGHQRAGLLYGRHVIHREVPLGIRAEVAAIYEPPQEGTADHLKLLQDDNKAAVDQLAARLGLVCVGWVFTDLVPLDASSGTVRHLRHSDTYFLSSHEVITAASLQLQHPSACTLARDGVYGSKFATVIVTGDSDNQVHMEGYQVSHQCEALVSAACLLPTLDAPELAYVKESSSKQYVPDVFFKEKDEYGNEVTRLGRPLPVEYLLLDLPVSTPNEPTHTFTQRSEDAFPIENRLVEGHLQDFNSLAKYLKTITDDTSFLEALSDFHVLLYLSTMDVLPMRDEMSPLLEAVVAKDQSAASAWRKSDTWSTLEQLVDATPVPAAPVASRNGVGSTSAPWTCTHCTFINTDGGETCDMCHLPR